MDRPWQGKSIVIVDDNQPTRNELRGYFEALGLSVVGEAANGVEALEVIKERSPDLVSLDIIMPEMDGIECYKKIQKLDSKKPVCFFVSALAGEHRVTECYAENIGLDKFVAKPVTQADLEQRLAILTGSGLLKAAPAEPAL